jgi:hypothetical protein
MSKTWRVGVISSTGRGNYGHGVDVAFTKVPDVTVADGNDAGRSQTQNRVSAAKHTQTTERCSPRSNWTSWRFARVGLTSITPEVIDRTSPFFFRACTNAVKGINL